MKLQDVIALMGGFISGINVFFTLISTNLNIFLRENALINDIFKYDNIKANPNNKDKESIISLFSISKHQRNNLINKNESKVLDHFTKDFELSRTNSSNINQFVERNHKHSA